MKNKDYTKRSVLFNLLKILNEQTDENNKITSRQLKELLKEDEKIPDTRTINSAVDLLNELGYRISVDKEDTGRVKGEAGEEEKVMRVTGYYIHSGDREYTPSEIRLLAEAANTFPFITKKESDGIIEKLKRQVNNQQWCKYNHFDFVRANRKTDNKYVMWNVEVLEEAVSKKCKVSFKYMSYRLVKENGKLVAKQQPRRNEKYTVNPFGMVYMNSNYYLICAHENHEADTVFYRADRMKEIEILENQPITAVMNSEEITNPIYAYPGEREDIAIRCRNDILDKVVDEFGTDVWFKKDDDNHFIMEVSAPPKGVKLWALQYIERVEVISPESLRAELVEIITNNPYIK